MTAAPHFHFVTLFPETIDVWLRTSILGRALKHGLFQYDTYQLRTFANDKHSTVDDVAYGGGGGMVLKAEPLARAVESLWERFGREKVVTVYFSPGGKRMTQALIGNLFEQHRDKHLVLICGHYEGVDERFVEGWVDLEISLGDFVLTGGELPALAFADAFIRQIGGVLGNETGNRCESFLLGSTHPLLEYPHFTRPSDFRGKRVPEVLLSGNHAEIAKWRLDEAQKKTQLIRPDLLES